jgi:hypothetical protein
MKPKGIESSFLANVCLTGSGEMGLLHMPPTEWTDTQEALSLRREQQPCPQGAPV